MPANVSILFEVCTKDDAKKKSLMIEADCATINISPAIVSLIMDVVTTILPKKKVRLVTFSVSVCGCEFCEVV